MKNTKDIPKGFYCYDKNGHCTHYAILPDLPEQANGFCSFMGKSDQDLNKEYAKTVRIKKSKDKSVEGELVVDVYGKPFEFSLLWDQVKECGENMVETE
jgi:hypothetical protein